MIWATFVYRSSSPAAWTMARSPPPRGQKPTEKFTAVISPTDEACVLYEELVQSRDRLADLPALTPRDVETVIQLLHELIWFLITPPSRATWPPPLGDAAGTDLVLAARNRSLDTYVTVAALLAWKKAALVREDKATAATQLDAIGDALDNLTFDYRMPKRRLLDLLRGVRGDLDARIAYISQLRRPSYRFTNVPERYNDRKNKRERPDEFFKRVYAAHVARGMTQADIRTADPRFYNVLHVWCSRNNRKLSSFLPPARSRA
jgi:hypothetical protein